MHTEKMGGTEATSPVVFARVVTGMIVFARGAGGYWAEEAKNVAVSVADTLSDAAWLRGEHNALTRILSI